MIEDFKRRGKWWIPGFRNNRVAGTLTFSPRNGGSLELNSSLHNDSSRAGHYDIIQGKLSDGRKITLHDCLEIPPGSATIKSSIKVGVIFVGRHFDSSNDIKFIGVKLQYSYLDEWLNRYRRTIRAEINKDYFLEIQPTFNYQSNQLSRTNVNIQQSHMVKIDSSQEQSFDEYVHVKNRLRDFLTLAVSESVQTLRFEGEVRTHNAGDVGTAASDTNVIIFYRTTNFVYPNERISKRHILFTYRSIVSRFANAISNWFRKEQTLEPVYDLYFGTIYDPDMYVSYQFLSFMQAIETYHRRTRKNEELSPEEHKKRIDAIINAAPQQYEPWLKCKLKYSNEPSLRKRLRELVKKDLANVAELFVEDKNCYINKLVNTRNYLTHYGSDLSEAVAKDEELLKLTGRAKLLLGSCLLYELGFTPDEIEKMIRKSPHYSYLRRKY